MLVQKIKMINYSKEKCLSALSSADLTQESVFIADNLSLLDYQNKRILSLSDATLQMKQNIRSEEKFVLALDEYLIHDDVFNVMVENDDASIEENINVLVISIFGGILFTKARIKLSNKEYYNIDGQKIDEIASNFKIGKYLESVSLNYGTLSLKKGQYVHVPPYHGKTVMLTNNKCRCVEENYMYKGDLKEKIILTSNYTDKPLYTCLIRLTTSIAKQLFNDLSNKKLTVDEFTNAISAIQLFDIGYKLHEILIKERKISKVMFFDNAEDIKITEKDDSVEFSSSKCVIYNITRSEDSIYLHRCN